MDDEPLRIPITDVFDLHSVPDRDVKAVVEEYLREARTRGFRYVRRECVRAILAGADCVESYGEAPPEAGGWGATVAVLRARD